jgi:hypothetical protein
MKTQPSGEYEKDFYAWTSHNAQLLRKGKFSQLDIKNVAEEIESMGKRDKRELISRLSILIAHLLKWQFQSVRRSKSCLLTIKNQRLDIIDLLKESPSLKHEIELQFSHAYKKAILYAAEQTGLEENVFPSECPFTSAQCLDTQFFPE